MQVDISHTWILFSSIFLAFSFVFGATIKAAFEAILFLFATHPFDVGDMLLLDSERYKVCGLRVLLSGARAHRST